jgi:hypothetical protein
MLESAESLSLEPQVPELEITFNRLAVVKEVPGTTKEAALSTEGSNDWPKEGPATVIVPIVDLKSAKLQLRSQHQQTL